MRVPEKTCRATAPGAFLLLPAFVIGVASCAGGQRATRLTIHDALRIEPGQVHEECFEADADQAVTYAFSADGPLDFNIHYHLGSEIGYPVREDGSTGAAGVFEPRFAQTYCLMWENASGVTVNLEYDATVADRQREAEGR